MRSAVYLVFDQALTLIVLFIHKVNLTVVVIACLSFNYAPRTTHFVPLRLGLLRVYSIGYQRLGRCALSGTNI